MYSLSSLHTFGLDSHAQTLIGVDSILALKEALNSVSNQPYYVLGEGSNSVFIENFLGVVIKVNLKGVGIEQTADDYLVKAGAGENWHQLVNTCLEQKMYGLENLALIPGTVGAAPIQNIGAYGVEVERFIEQVDYLDLQTNKLCSLSRQQCQFDYRDSIFKHKLLGQAVITHVTFRLPKQWQAVTHYGELKTLKSPSPEDIFHKVIEVRESKLPDPSKLGNAGSFFKNPIIDKSTFETLQLKWPTMPSYMVDQHQLKVPAAWLIDTLGFKGQQVGGIGCHPQHALVLTNHGKGTGPELLTFARKIKQQVLEVFGIELENEVRLVGQNGLVAL